MPWEQRRPLGLGGRSILASARRATVLDFIRNSTHRMLWRDVALQINRAQQTNHAWRCSNTLRTEREGRDGCSEPAQAVLRPVDGLERYLPSVITE